MSVIGSNVLAGASGGAGAAAGFRIDRSLRFNNDDSAHLNRTPSSSGNRRTWTWSCWLKRSGLADRQEIFAAGSDGTDFFFDSDDKLHFYYYESGAYQGWCKTNSVFRDVSAWYHIVLVFDSTQSTVSDIVKIYVNNVLQPLTFNNNFTVNDQADINNNVAHYIGRYSNGNSEFADYYLAEVHHVDGSALAPTDFGEFDDNGVWQPIEFTPSTEYSTSAITGVTGLNTSFTTDAGTANAFGSGNIDEGTYDRKTNGGVLDVTLSPAQSGNFVVYTGAINETSNYTIVFEYGDGSTETVLNNSTSTRNGPGNTCTVNVGQKSNVVGFTVDCQDNNDTQLCGVTVDGTKLVTGQAYGKQVTLTDGTNLDQFPVDTVVSNGDKVTARDTTNNTLSLDGTSWATGQYVTKGGYGTNGFYLDFSDNSSNAALGTDSSGNSNDWTVNNLVATAPGLETANQGMDVLLYTGDGEASRAMTGLQFQPDLVWIKQRSANGAHMLFDSVRGVTKRLVSNQDIAEGTVQGVLSFDSNGFTLGNDADCNFSGRTHVAWAWKAGGTAVSNTDGTITSSVSANTDYGFSVGTYTGTYTAQPTTLDTVGHGLNAAPGLIITKSRSATSNWHVWHSDLANNEYIRLNSTNAKATLSSGAGGSIATAPTSSVFPTYFIGGSNNGSSDDLVFYCWSEVSGFSKFSSYVGDGSNTKKITTGFKPRFLLVKPSSSTGNWNIFDSERPPNTATITYSLQPNLDNAEYQSEPGITFLDDGFTLNSVNTNGVTYVYAAFADKPPGESIDSLIDTPTNADTPTDTGAGGEVVGNYCTWNPLDTNSATLSNGNLDITTPSSGHGKTRGTIAVFSGKWYWEHTISSGATSIGILDASEAIDTSFLGETSGAYVYYSEGASYTKKINGNTRTDYGASFGAGDVIGVALDLDGGTLTFYKNGSSQGQAFSSISGTYAPAISDGTNSGSVSGSTNWGQRPFAYTAPSGYKALCTANSTDPTIADGSTAMDVALYTGNGSTQTISGLDFSPDLVWIKERNGDVSHQLYDAVRGATKKLSSNTTDTETTTSNGLTAFNSDGFSLGNYSSVNNNNDTYAAWTWDAGSSTVTNTDGSITSSVRANPSAGFSIVSYSGNSTNNSTIGHGLNAAPELIITKNRSAAYNWITYSAELAATKVLALDTTNAAFTPSGGYYSNVGSSTYQVVQGSANLTNLNNSGDDYIAYCFAPVAGYSAFGSYTGNGSADGPFVFTGFRPKWVLLKSSTVTGSWVIYDASRNTYNVANSGLYPNYTNAEGSGANNKIDILSNGFKVRGVGGSDPATNTNNETIVYACFAEHPFKTARAR